MYTLKKENLEIIATLKPELSVDGNQFCFLFGSNPMEGCAGYGNTVSEAVNEFCENFFNRQVPPEQENNIPDDCGHEVDKFRYITDKDIETNIVPKDTVIFKAGLNEQEEKEKEIEKLYEIRNSLNNQCYELRKQVDELKKDYAKAVDDIAKHIKEKCALQKENIGLKEKIKNIEKQNKEHKHLIDFLKNDVNFYSKELEQLSKEKANLKQEIAEYKQKERKYPPKPQIIECPDMIDFEKIKDNMVNIGLNDDTIECILSGTQIYI